MEMTIRKKDIERLLKKEFGPETEVIEFEKDKIVIDVDMFTFRNGGSDSSFQDNRKETTQTIPSQTISKENQKLTPEQERYIRMETARYGGVGKDLNKAPVMKRAGDGGERVVEQYAGEPVKKSGSFIDKKHGTILDGVK